MRGVYLFLAMSFTAGASAWHPPVALRAAPRVATIPRLPAASRHTALVTMRLPLGDAPARAAPVALAFLVSRRPIVNVVLVAAAVVAIGSVVILVPSLRSTLHPRDREKSMGVGCCCAHAACGQARAQHVRRDVS